MHDAKLFVLERLMTDGEQKAESNIEVTMNGSGSAAQIVSRSVGKGHSSQVFHPRAIGKNKCHAHIQCDSIIMDHAESKLHTGDPGKACGCSDHP